MNNLKNQNGQTLVEFVLLLALLFSLSFSLLRGVNVPIGKKWESMLKIIAIPNENTVQIP